MRYQSQWITQGCYGEDKLTQNLTRFSEEHPEARLITVFRFNGGEYEAIWEIENAPSR